MADGYTDDVSNDVPEVNNDGSPSNGGFPDDVVNPR